MNGRRLVAVVVLGAAAATLAGCVAVPPDPGPDTDAPCGALRVVPLPRCSVAPIVEIEEVVVSQAQAVPGFDGGPFVVDDPEMIDDLEDALTWWTARDQTIGDACPGSRASTIEVVESSVGAFTIALDTCTDDAFVQELDAIVTGWIATGELERLAP